MKYYACNPRSRQFTELSISSFERDTEKKFPYYQTIGGEKRYFAYCPGCDNPITVINLYTDKRVEEDGTKQKAHGRHYPHNISNFPSFDKEAYEQCPFAKPSSFSGTTKRGAGVDSNELIEIITKHTDSLYSFSRSISGVNLADSLFEKMLKTFAESDGIFFRHVNKFNLPYALLYMAHNQSLYYQFLYQPEKNPIARAIKDTSKWFEVVNGQIKPKDKKAAQFINMYFTDHKISNHDDEPLHKFTQVITESSNGDKNTILEREIIFDNYLFYKTVNKNERLRTIAEQIFGSS